jgi:putative ABC transport system permease protein
MNRVEPVAVRIAAALVGAATRALPGAFRRAFGGDVREAFLDDASDAYRAGGSRRLIRTTVAALADIADVGSHRQNPAAERRTRPLSGLAQDVSYALRTFRRQPAFTITAILMLAVGIGGNAAVFSLVNASLLRPLPYPGADRLVRVWGVRDHADAQRQPVNPNDAADWARGAAAIEALGVWTATTQPLTSAGDPMTIPVAFATSGFLPALQVSPAMGQDFGPEHDAPGRETDIVITDGFWRRVLGADPNVLGRTIRLADVACSIIGVLPPDFVSPGIPSGAEPQIWRLLVVAPDNRGGHFASAIARLRPDASLTEAQAQIDTVAEQLSRHFPSTNLGQRARLEPLREAIAGDSRPAMLLLMAAVAVVLLIACANVANLLLARAAVRQREIGLRGALGASRGRIVQQLMTESLMLAGVATLMGAGLGALALGSLPGWLSEQLPTVMQVTLDGRVVAFTAGLSVATVIVFGTLPAIIASRFDLRGTLAATAAGAGSPPRRLQAALVVVETALALVLLVSATLLVQSLARLQGVDPGFTKAQTLTFRVSLPRTRYPAPERRTAFLESLADRLASLPGVVSAGGVNTSPLSGRYSCDSFALADRPAPPDGQEPCAEVRVATPGYFEAMGIPLLTGRQLAPSDNPGTVPVAVIGDSMARRYWPGANPVGQRLKWGSLAADTPWLTIVGVVGDVKHFGLSEDAPDEVYMPLRQLSASAFTFAVRTDSDPLMLHLAVRAAVRDADPELPLSEVFTTRELVARSVALPVFRTTLLSVFAALALLLAMTGVYGLMAFHVVQRKREIGIRLALGAKPREIQRLVVGQGMTLAGVGCLAGLLAAVPAMTLTRSVLFGVTTDQPLPYLMGAVVLIAAALLASYVPARRASTVSPLDSIRFE